MSSRRQPAQLKKQILAAVLLSLFILTPAPVFAKEQTDALPSLQNFIESVKDGSINTLRGIYVQDVMAFPVVQQPSGNPGYVSANPAAVTQFKMAAEMGNIGLLAHNYLAGADFSKLKKNDTITLVYGNGHTQSFIVDDILEYQALSPLSPYSDFKDLAAQKTLTAEQLFNKVYRGDFHLTLQTCIQKDGDLSWGRLFIIAKPVSDKTAAFLN